MLIGRTWIVFFFKQKTAYENRLSLVGSEMCIRDSLINSNSDKTVVTAGAKGIDIRVVDTAGDVVKEHKIPRNNR